MLEFLQCLNLTLGKQYTQIFYSDLDAVDIKSMDNSSWVCKIAFSVGVLVRNFWNLTGCCYRYASNL